MSEDFIRNSLVTAFVCVECGSNLSLSYKSKKGSGRMVDDEPTGAAMVKNVIYIYPCEKCLEPAIKAKQAVMALMEI